MTNKAYTEVINKIVADKRKIFGQPAIEIARRTYGLELTKSGKVVSIARDEKAIIKDLLINYEQIAGKVATITARIGVTGILSKYPDLDMPKELFKE